jgi:type VII secretion protein EssB
MIVAEYGGEEVRLFDGRDGLEFERTKERVTVSVTGAQIRMSSIGAIRRHVAVEEACLEGFQAALVYPVLPGAVTLRRAASDAKTRLAKLALARRLATLATAADSFKVPFLHPDNVVLSGVGASLIHSGLLGMLAPMSADTEHFLAGYKALVIGIFAPRLRFEHLVSGASVLQDPLGRRIAGCATVDAVIAVIDEEFGAESERAARRLVSLPRLRHRLTTMIGSVAVVVAAVLGWCTWDAYAVTQPRQDAIIRAQAHFVVGDFGKTLTDLEGYSVSDLPKSARYALAVSSVKLSDLTGTQKDAVLNNISTRTDDNTLEYWISLARGELDAALDLAQKIGDDQLTLLAYTDLYQATKLNNSMDGARKQKALDEYNKKIDELSARLGAAK